MLSQVVFKLLPSADGQDLQQAGGGHLQGCAELGHPRFLQELEGLPQHGLCAAQLRQHVEEPAGDGQGDVHGLVTDAQSKHCHQQEALLSFYIGERNEDGSDVENKTCISQSSQGCHAGGNRFIIHIQLQEKLPTKIPVTAPVMRRKKD